MMSDSERETWVRLLRVELDEAQQTCDEAAERLREAEADRQALVRMLHRADPQVSQQALDLDPARKSYRVMLVEMAQANGGRLTTQEASQRLADAGLFSTPRRANKSISTILARAQKDFQQEGRGAWRYIGGGQGSLPPLG